MCAHYTGTSHAIPSNFATMLDIWFKRGMRKKKSAWPLTAAVVDAIAQ